MIGITQTFALLGYVLLFGSAACFFMGMKVREKRPVAGQRWLMGGVAVAAVAVVLLGLAAQ